MTEILPQCRSGLPRSVLAFTLLSAWIAAGCGSNAGNGQAAPKIIQSPQTPPVRQLPSTPPNDQPQFAAKPATPTTKPKSAKPAVPSGEQFPDEVPGNIFTIAESPSPVALGSADETAAIDRVTLDDFPEGADSTTFTIDGVQNQPVTTTKSSSARLPAGFEEVAEFGYADDGLPWRIRCEKSGGLMALVPGGAARIGSNSGADEIQPEFQPYLDTFYMDINEVTVGQYHRFRDDIRQKKNSKVQLPINDDQAEDMPALGLPWGIVQGFVNWAGQELPTEAEWEYAARGPAGWRTPWGNGKAVWPQGRTVDDIRPVQSFPTDQSPLGIFDLAGNAREWCADLYSPISHREASQASAKLLRNWAGSKKGIVTGQRVIKGNGPDWSVWHRAGRLANDKHPDVGFRGVLRLKSAPGA